MSVLQRNRTESRAEFVNTANQIYAETVGFLSRLSSRYARIFVGPISQMASDVLRHAESANSIFPKDKAKLPIRTEHLTEARAALMSLDVHLAHCYNVMMLNPQGCFTTASGKSINASTAKQRLEHMAQNLGELIDKEDALLKSVMKSDKER